jgi:hypothetical protein
VQQQRQAAADTDPLRTHRRLPDGSLQPVQVEIQTWERLSPAVKQRWIDKAHAELAAENPKAQGSGS